MARFIQPTGLCILILISISLVSASETTINIDEENNCKENRFEYPVPVPVLMPHGLVALVGSLMIDGTSLCRDHQDTGHTVTKQGI